MHSQRDDSDIGISVAPVPPGLSFANLNGEDYRLSVSAGEDADLDQARAAISEREGEGVFVEWRARSDAVGRRRRLSENRCLTGRAIDWFLESCFDRDSFRERDRGHTIEPDSRRKCAG